MIHIRLGIFFIVGGGPLWLAVCGYWWMHEKVSAWLFLAMVPLPFVLPLLSIWLDRAAIRWMDEHNWW